MVYIYIPLHCRIMLRRSMKSSELHRKVRKNGWTYLRCEGSHYIYEKDGKTYPVPYHGSKEVGKGLEKKITKEMGL
ncbi:type II toxin-antitoxin system HicA family toxin [Chryseobacterium cucumeris]|jgi:mRNA interferase HicA|uniref:type II toxin-antitoxin system HicA family toxin n=1 Tax=Chryseobacterium TaxID=59732 RepID=UPI00320A80B5